MIVVQDPAHGHTVLQDHLVGGEVVVAGDPTAGAALVPAPSSRVGDSKTKVATEAAPWQPAADGTRANSSETRRFSASSPNTACSMVRSPRTLHRIWTFA